MNGNGDSNGNGDAPVGAGPLAWFTSGVARWLLVLVALLAVLIAGLSLSLAGDLPETVVFRAVESIALLIIGGLLPLMGARQMADAKDKRGAGENPPAPPGASGT